MGIVCCSPNNTIEIEIQRGIINSNFHSNHKISSLNEIIILLQSYYRRHLSIKKLKFEIESKKEQVFSQLDKNKLMNNEIISECQSEKMYQTYLLNGEIKSYMEIVNSNKKIKTNLRLLEKYSFFIPNYIVASPTEVYKGSWNLNKKYHGYGVKYEFDKINNIDTRTEGTFNNGFLFGMGRMVVSNGEIFFGLFVYGKMTGMGEYIRQDGFKYEGEFSEGVPNGKGKEQLPDGTIFEGIYFGGMRRKGKIIWTDGSSFDGYFEKGQFNGHGKYIWANQKQYEGEWKDGKMNGKGKFLYPDGSYYEGEFMYGKKNGMGKYVWDKDKFYIGEWKDDKQNGKGIYNKNGKEIKGFWADGHLFSKTVGGNSNIFREVRKRPTIGAYSLKNQKCNVHNKFLNDSSDKIYSSRTNLKSKTSLTIIKNNNSVKSGISNVNTMKFKNINNQKDDEEFEKINNNPFKVNKHKYIKSNKF